MVFHMAKTTLVIDDEVMTRLRERAARGGTTLSELVEAALRRMLEEPRVPDVLDELPVFHCGEPLVDVANRDALYRVMEED
jgi:Ribbon-helix-helix protein, copG family